MIRYKNRSRHSGVIAYECGDDFIRVQFVSGAPYTYSYRKAGRRHVERMKALARSGTGLATYISRYVKDLYD